MQPVELHGKTLSLGLGQGVVYVYRDILDRFDEDYDIEEHQIAEEHDRFAEAVKQITSDLEILASRIRDDIDASLSEIFEAHIMMIQDPTLKKDVENEISGELAGRSQFTQQILDCGMTSLSVAPCSIPIVKQAIRNSC